MRGRIQTFLKEGENRGDPNPTSQFHRKYYFGQGEKEMKLCLMILSVPWYMINGLEHIPIIILWDEVPAMVEIAIFSISLMA
jgi:hypothetical protein